MRADLDAVQGAVILASAVMLALVYATFNARIRLVHFLYLHYLISNLLCAFVL